MGYIYVICENDSHDFFKVGYSKSPERRLNGLQTSNPRKLKIVRKFRGTESDEKRLHWELRSHRVLNEWFRNNAETRAILGVKSAPEREFCQRQAFTFIANLYAFMKDRNKIYVDAKQYCTLRGIDFDPDFAEFCCFQCKHVINLNYIEYKHMVAFYDYVGPEYEEPKPFFTFGL